MPARLRAITAHSNWLFGRSAAMMRTMFELEKPSHPLDLARQGSKAAGGGAVAGACLGALFGAIAGAFAGVTAWSFMTISREAWRRYSHKGE